ncbi:regulator of chromosome condensation [Anaeramoeba ignava]|uniref:Regulator of chromosome condensation n=1 Tax=Anaeramoeba ignava TaxID=1746090 RepID=A0A9Q0LMP5_ANAIG|nr:regulator of chromosome condensation [Anaeramoeba ignava]
MNDCLFFGDNKFPILIKNEPDRITKPIQFKFKFEFENENEKQIKQISSGNYSTIFLFKNGKAIEYLNRNDLNQKPSKIQIENIQKVTVGGENEAILTKEGNVFAKGYDIDSKNSKEFINISSLIEDKNDRIIRRCCFWSSQLGFNSKKLYNTEKPILMMKNVSKIFSGICSKLVFLLNSNQELFGCGLNDYSQIGLRKSRRKKREIQKLTKIKNIPKGKIIDIQCGGFHSIMSIENENQNPKRKLYSCGDYIYNGLGKNEDTYKFTEIKSSLFENDDNIIEISVGYFHTLILTSKSKLLVFGDNAYGQLGTGNTSRTDLIPIQIELPKLRFNEDISNYHVSCGNYRSFLYYSPFSPFSNLEEDLIKLFKRKEFCDISFKTKNGEIIEAHKLILEYRLKDQNEIEKLKEIISKKSIKESNQIFEMIYSNRIINPKLYSEIKEIINSNEKIEETMKRIYLNENENPIKFKFENENENEKQIKQISSGNYSTIFLFENGKTMEYLKENYSNQKPSKIQIEENIQKVTVGSRNEAILTIEGNVFAKGKDINPKNPKEFINISSLIEDKNDRIIKDIVSGSNSIYLLTSNQNAYGIGSNGYGQLGFDSETLKKTEKPILMMKNVSKIFSGNSSLRVFLLNPNQELFGCGWNQSGQLGLRKSRKETKIHKLTKIQNIPKGKIIDIQCGHSHSIMLIEEDDENENPKRKLYSCGVGFYNGLGKNKDTYEFTEIKSSLFENDDNILDFSVGYSHTLILTSKGKLLVFGYNFYGQLGTGNTNDQSIPIQIELPKLRFNEDISNYHIYYLIKLFERKEFCDISFKTENGEIIEAHKLILKYRLNQNENQIEKLQEIISKKSIKESNQIFEMIYSNNSKINPKLYSEIKEIINSNEKIEETMKRIYLNENENENVKDFIIERKEKQYKFPKLILIMRSELYRGMFLSVTEDKSNKVTDYSELRNYSTIFLFENGKAIEYLNRNDLNQKPSKIQIENIQKVTVGYSNEAILTKEGNVFAKGKDIYTKNPKEFINISSLIKDKNDRIIKDIVSGSNSIYLLTSNQNAYGIGSNHNGQLGFDSEPLKKTEKPILMMKNVSKIFSGICSIHVFLLNSNQELFGCGNNDYGKITDIQCGDSYSIMLIEDENENPKRKLYSCGFTKYNGLGKNKDTYKFTEIKSSLFENNDNIIEISVGYYHTLILTSNSKMIGFGYNYDGELGTGNTKYQLIPIQIELPKLRFNEDISNYHIYCGYYRSFLYYSPFSFSNLEEDLIKLFKRKEFCDISFKTENGEIIEAHKLILEYRLNENQIEKLKEIISKKSIKESNQIFEMIYSNRIINPKLYSEIKEIINSNEKIEETMKRIYLNENENVKDFIIERKEKQYKFPKLILIMRSELYRGMFLSVTNDTSNKVTDYSELSNKSFQIFEYWIYSNKIKEEIQITQEIINELKRGIDYFQLNQTNPNLFDLLINKFNNQN